MYCQHWLTWAVVSFFLCSSFFQEFSTFQLDSEALFKSAQVGSHHLPKVDQTGSWDSHSSMNRFWTNSWMNFHSQVFLTLCALCSLLGRSRAATDACCAQPALLCHQHRRVTLVHSCCLCYSCVMCTHLLCYCCATSIIVLLFCNPVACVTLV